MATTTDPAQPRPVRQETDEDIFLNTIDWYEDNDITLYAGCGSRGSTGSRNCLLRRRSDHALRQAIVATGSGAFMPDGGMYLPGSRGEDPPPASSRSARSTTPGDDRHAQRDEHRKAVVVGGGLLGLEAARLQRYESRSRSSTPRSTS
jgi:nitrite reductase (NADH) large subunit